MPNTAKTIYTINQSQVTAWLDDKFVRSLLINLFGIIARKGKWTWASVAGDIHETYL